MDKYTKAVLTVIALCMLALPVKAEEKVWYCVSSENIKLTHDKLERYVSARFKIKVTPDRVEFGSGGLTEGISESMQFYGGPDFWTASTDGIITVKMMNGNLSFVVQGFEEFSGFVAKCDEF